MNKIKKDFKLRYDISLKKLRSSYSKEMSRGNYIHLTDYIALDVLDSLKLLHFNLRGVNEGDIRFINLKRLFTEQDTWNPFKDDFKDEDNRLIPYVIPSLEHIHNFLNRYLNIFKRRHNSGASFQKAVEEYAGTIWIKDMIKFGFFEPGDLINLEEFKLIDFITDDRLKELFGFSSVERKHFSEYNRKRRAS